MTINIIKDNINSQIYQKCLKQIKSAAFNFLVKIDSGTKMEKCEIFYYIMLKYGVGTATKEKASKDKKPAEKKT